MADPQTRGLRSTSLWGLGGVRLVHNDEREVYLVRLEERP